MAVTFAAHGGANYIGASCSVLTVDDRRICFDWGGNYHGNPQVGPAYPADGPPLDHLFLTHAHLDHIGMAVRAILRWPNMVVWATRETKLLAESVWEEMRQVAFLRRLPEPFSAMDIQRAIARIREVVPGCRVDLGNRLSVEAVWAGHVLGAVSYVLGYRGAAYVFTGDISNRPGMLFHPAERFRIEPENCELLVRDSTYLGDDREPFDESRVAFLQTLTGILEAGGRVLMPCPATGRIQEMIAFLKKEGIHTRYDVFVEGAVNRTGLFRKLAPGGDTLSDIRRFFNRNEREAIRRSYAPAVILATSAMMAEGSLSFDWAQSILPRKDDAVILPTWVDPCSPAGQVLEHRDAESVSILSDGQSPRVVARIRRRPKVFRFDLFSGHIDRKGGEELEHRLNPRTIVYVHGDDRKIDTYLHGNPGGPAGAVRIKGTENNPIVLG